MIAPLVGSSGNGDQSPITPGILGKSLMRESRNGASYGAIGVAPGIIRESAPYLHTSHPSQSQKSIPSERYVDTMREK